MSKASMIVWIVDSDPSDSYRLKKEIKSPKVIVEVYDTAASFFEALAESKKDKSKLPQLIFLEVNLPDTSGVEVYLNLLQENNPIAEKIVFVSNVSYGRFEICFTEKNIKIPQFVQKNQIINEVKKIIPRYEKETKQAKPTREITLALRDLELLLKEMNERYYEAQYNKASQKLWSDCVALFKIVQKFKWIKISNVLEKLIALKEKTPLIRALKELKEIILLCEKEKKKWE